MLPLVLVVVVVIGWCAEGGASHLCPMPPCVLQWQTLKQPQALALAFALAMALAPALVLAPNPSLCPNPSPTPSPSPDEGPGQSRLTQTMNTHCSALESTECPWAIQATMSNLIKMRKLRFVDGLARHHVSKAWQSFGKAHPQSPLPDSPGWESVHVSKH